MPIPDEREDAVKPFYYFVVAFSTLHVLVASALFVRQRTKFPVSGHNIYLAIFFSVAITGGLIAGSFQGAVSAETCSVAMATVSTFVLPAANLLTAQAARLWYEYNLADERLQTIRAGGGDDAQSGWFAHLRRFFHGNRPIVGALGISLVEVLLGVGFLMSLQGNGFADEVKCMDLLPIVVVIFTFSVFISSVIGYLLLLKFRDKSDGFGIKRMLKNLALVANIASPPVFIIYVWEAVDDLPYYAAAIRVLFHFIAANMFVFFMMDWHLYLSFVESAQRRMSSISVRRDENDNGVVDEDEQMKEVLDLASGREVPSGIALQSRGTEQGASQGDDGGGAPEVFSSRTLTLSLEEILLNPAYGAQMASLARHLVGEFNVEGLLFFLKVRKFQEFAKSRRASLETELRSGAKGFAILEDAENSRSLSSVSLGSCDGDAADVGKSADEDVDVDAHTAAAWRALSLYFEFLEDDAPAKINIGHRVAVAITFEFEASLVDFRQLPHTVDRHDLRLKKPLDTTIFDQAQGNILRLIESDPFVRWRKVIRERLEEHTQNGMV